jgi:cell division protein FtsB
MIEFLKPPTDNLYKFMCICGLILFLVSVTYPTWLLNKLVHSYYENRRDSEVLRVDVDSHQWRGELLSRQQDALGTEYDAITRRVDRLKQRAATQSSRQSAITEKELAQLTEAESKLDEKNREILKAALEGFAIANTHLEKQIELNYRLKAAQWEVRSSIAISILGILGAGAGALLCRQGFNLWSLRVQVFQDAILRKQAAQEPEDAPELPNP